MAVALALCVAPAAFPAPTNSVPKLDKTKFVEYIRYAEGFPPEVQATVDDPTPSPFRGLFSVTVHFSAGAQKLDKIYYVSADGEQIINGPVWDMKDNPFRDTLEHLPTDGPSFGPASAKVTIIVFSDFECPYCRELAKTIRDNVPAKYPTDVRVVFKDFPLDAIHHWARPAAEASHCIASQKPAAFWAFHDYMFEHQEEIGNQLKTDPRAVRAKALEIAKRQNLDAARLSACMDSHATAEEVDKNQKAGQRLQVRQTPTLFVNGRLVSGALQWPALDSVIKMELNRPKNIAMAKTDKCCEVTLPVVGKNQ
jgi:protein-disulfide isomerase